MLMSMSRPSMSSISRSGELTVMSMKSRLSASKATSQWKQAKGQTSPTMYVGVSEWPQPRWCTMS